jgi:hypothetical protein
LGLRLLKKQLFRILCALSLSSCGFAQYAGPAILSRGEAPAALQTPEVSFRPYADFSAVYDGGLAGVTLQEDGSLRNAGSAGIRANWGISGTHSWRHTKLGLDYRGSLTHYNNSYFDSTDQALLLGVSHQFSPHMLLTLRESAGTFGRNFQLPGLSQTVPFDPVASYIPTVDYFDNRTYYMSTQADLTIQRSARLVFNVGGDGFITRRRAAALTGAIGASARGDIEYRLTRHTSLGAIYNYSRFEFTNTDGGTDIHTFDGGYSVQLTRNLEFSGYGGMMRVESKFIRLAAIDPVIAALLGISAAPQIVHTIGNKPNFAGRLSRRYQRGVFYVNGGYTATPGNGLFLTSFSKAVTAGYTYTGMRTWAFSTYGAYNDSTATGSITGNYRAGTGSVSISRQITRSVHALVEAGIRKYDSGDFSGYNRAVFFCRAGIGVTPGNLPFRLW